jgi:hypothetical protein
MAEPTDAGYENSRRKAERAFFLASVDWFKRVVRDAKKLAIPPKTDENKMLALAEAGAAAWSGEPFDPQTPPRRRVSTDVLLKLVELCEKYGEAEIRAYTALLQRKCVPPSQAINELDEHAETILREIRKRKWTPNIEHITGLFDSGPWINEGWHFVEKRIREVIQYDLHGLLWFHQDGWISPSDTEAVESVKKKGGRPQTIPDERKAAALKIRDSGGTLRDAAVKLYSKYPTPQQVKNTSTILRVYKQGLKKSHSCGSKHSERSRNPNKNRG